jgi:integrase
VSDYKIFSKMLRSMFGREDLGAFSAEHLEAFRNKLIRDGHVAPQVNKRIGQCRQFIYWTIENDLFPENRNAARLERKLKRVKAIGAGQFGAKAGKVVEPADPVAFAKALPLMSPVPRAVAELLRLTGARPSEILNMRPRELDRSATTWRLVPEWHKGASRPKAKPRVIHLGVESQRVLAPWLLGCGLNEHVFTSAKSEAKRQRERSDARETPKWESHLRRNEEKRASERKRPPSDRPFAPTALYKAFTYACQRAGVPIFSPYQLRHLKAVELREQHGLEFVRATLGHSFAAMSDHYSRHADAALASRVAL